ncbi:MAG: hypothetical protein RL338_1427 [Chloroflexota bacterium]
MRRSLISGLTAVLLATGSLATSAPIADAGRATTPVTLKCDGPTEFYAPAGTLVEFTWQAGCGGYDLWNVSEVVDGTGTENGFLVAPKSPFLYGCYDLCGTSYTPDDWYINASDQTTVTVKLAKSRKALGVTTSLAADDTVAMVDDGNSNELLVIWKGPTAP